MKNPLQVKKLQAGQLVLGGVVRAAPAAEVPVGQVNGFHIPGLARHQAFYPGQDVQEEALQENDITVCRVQVLVQHDQVVPEIEVQFPGIALGQAASAHVVHQGVRAVGNAVAGPLQAPAKVHLLHMGKKMGIKPAHPVKTFGTDKQRRPGGPENVLHRVILAMVFLRAVEDAPPAKGVAEDIHPPTGGTGIFKTGFIGKGTQLGLAGTYGLIGLHLGHDGLYPAGRHFHVLVQEYINIRLYMLQGLVVAACKARIGRVLDDADLWEMGPCIVHAIVGRRIIRQNKL